MLLTKRSVKDWPSNDNQLFHLGDLLVIPISIYEYVLLKYLAIDKTLSIAINRLCFSFYV